MNDFGRLMWSESDGEGQARLSLIWVFDAKQIDQLGMLQDWISDLQAKYDARLAYMPNWHAITRKDRDQIAAALRARIKQLEINNE